MKPVTEDQVQSLLDGLEKREKEALRALERRTRAASTATGRMTANVFRLRSSPRTVLSDGETEVVDIAVKRKERKRRITSKGFFFYTSEPRALGTH